MVCTSLLPGYKLLHAIATPRKSTGHQGDTQSRKYNTITYNILSEVSLISSEQEGWKQYKRETEDQSRGDSDSKPSLQCN